MHKIQLNKWSTCNKAEFGRSAVQIFPPYAERQDLELEAQMARQQKLAADLTRHGYKGAAAEALMRLRILQARRGRTAAVP